MSSPLSYRNLDTIRLVFYPPPTIYPATDTISVERGKTVTLTIKVSERFHTPAILRQQDVKVSRPLWFQDHFLVSVSISVS